MSRLPPLADDAVPAEAAALLKAGTDFMGFTPNDGRIMARRPALLKAVFELVQAVYAPDGVDAGLMKLIGLAASAAAGCIYCTAHTGHAAHTAGVAADKVAAFWDFERSPAFSEAERAALSFAQAASQTPSAVTDADMDRLKAHFDDDAIVQIMGVIGLFGFLNRWNAALATELEAEPGAFADTHLTAGGWQAGVHGGGRD